MTAVKLHLSLNVNDIERSTEWYETLLGTPTHKRRPGYANFDLENPPLKLALQQHSAEGGGPLNHLGLLVPTTEAVLAAKERLESAGLVTFSEENVSCCYARQDKIWVRDPDGNAWEVYTLLDDLLDEDDHHHAEGEAVTGCCQPAAIVDDACCEKGTSTCCS
jgi:catechol 2,3-dioxygenase-like lactoylglutathione lyase family enzyme